MKLTYEYGNFAVSIDSEKVDEYLNNDTNAVIYRDTYEENSGFWTRTEDEYDGNCKCFGCSTNFKKLDYCEMDEYREMRESLKMNIMQEFLLTEEMEEDDEFFDFYGDIQDDAYTLIETWCEVDSTI